MQRYYLDKGTLPTEDIIKQMIEANELERGRYQNLKNYYEGNHKINERMRNKDVNNKIVVNHCKFITDINTGYLMGNAISYTADESKDIKEIMKEYQNQGILNLDYRIAKETSIYGVKYELVYANSKNEVRSAPVEVENCIIAYDNTVEHNKMFAVIYKIKGAKYSRNYEYVKVYTDKEEINFAQGGKLMKVASKFHFFDKVPVIEYDNNEEQLGDFEPVLSLVDGYNLLQSDRMNDKEQLAEAILLFENVGLTDEQKATLNEQKVLETPPNSDVRYVTKTFNEDQIDILRKSIEADIHKISMTPNLTDQNFVGNASGVAIKYKLIAFEQSIKKKERAFEEGLRDRFYLYNTYLAKRRKADIVPVYDLNIIFKRNLPQNDYETSQMINNLSGMGIPQVELNAQLGFVDDATASMKAYKKEVKGLNNNSDETENFATDKANTDKTETDKAN